MSSQTTVCMSFNDITPYVRYVQHLQLNPLVPPFQKMTYDHRFTYVSSGKGMIQVENSDYCCEKGDLFYWGPATRYAVHRNSKDPLVLINVHFDFTRMHTNKKFTPPAVFLEDFNPAMVTEKIEFWDQSTFNSPFYIKDYFQGERPLLQIVEEYKLQKRFCNQYISGLFLTFLTSLERYMTTMMDKKKEPSNTADLVIDYIHTHYTEPLNNTKIAQLFNFHPNYLNKLMVVNTGMSLHQYVINVKIQKAIELISESNLSITEIAKALGFNDISHFSKTFRKKTGCNPTGI